MKQDLGKLYAQQLWPLFFPTQDGSDEDKNGIDGYLNGKTVQVKFDTAIANTGNIYHEVYEKSVYQTSQKWRHSPGVVDAYIFITEDKGCIYGYLTDIDGLAWAERGKALRLINPNKNGETSMGFIIPQDYISWKEAYYINKPKLF